MEYYKRLLAGGTSIEDIPGDIYDTLGESPIAKFLMIARDEGINGFNRSQMYSQWCSGREGGINFDLPTEAQWEYCCRDHSETAFPQENNLGENFDGRDERLDLIAWYKYKVIGDLPEPERFCTWRISKMMFGVSRDTEHINNVYEKDN